MSWLAFLAALFTVIAAPRGVRADDLAPDLLGSDLRLRAQAELRRLASSMPAKDRKRLAGLYVAFDADSGDPIAQVACDDDGDYVVLLSDAMLRLAAHVARAASYDEPEANVEVEAYASLLARSQIPGRRLLPPPPGFYAPAKPAATYEDRLNEILAFVVARELAHLRSGDLVCPQPTVTKEAGDDVWTSTERREAAETARAVYPGPQAERDTEATVRLLEAGRTAKGALALLRFFAHLETAQSSGGHEGVDRRVAFGAFTPTYAAHHPTAAARAAVVSLAAGRHRSTD